MQSSRVSLYICSRPIPKHMHTNTSSMKSFSKTCHTSSCYACSYSTFLVSLLARLQPQDLFLMPWDYILTGLRFALPWWSFNHGLNIQRSWLRYASAPTRSVLYVHTITLMQIISSHGFHKLSSIYAFLKFL
jgi:hypothetical protein